MYIALNTRWRVKVGKDTYTLFRHRRDNVWEMLKTVTGTRRVLMKLIRKNGIVTTAEADKMLAEIPECAGFPKDPEEKKE